MDQVDIHGLIKSEAEIEVKLFIKEAFLARKYFILIIHGTGKFILKSLVDELADSSPYVERFESAPPNLGGAGATIIYLKKRGMN